MSETIWKVSSIVKWSNGCRMFDRSNIDSRSSSNNSKEEEENNVISTAKSTDKEEEEKCKECELTRRIN